MPWASFVLVDEIPTEEMITIEFKCSTPLQGRYTTFQHDDGKGSVGRVKIGEVEAYGIIIPL